MWKLLYDRITTSDQLQKHHVISNPNCEIYPATMETTKHIFQECNMAIRTWQCDPSFINFNQNDPAPFQD